MAKNQPHLVHAVRGNGERDPTPAESAQRTIRKIAPNLSFATSRARMRARSTLVEMLKGMKDEHRPTHLPLASAIVDDFSKVLDLTLLRELPAESWKGIKPEARSFLLSEMALHTISEMGNGDHAKVELIDDTICFLFTHKSYPEIVILKKALFRSFDRAQLMEMRAELLKPYEKYV